MRSGYDIAIMGAGESGAGAAILAKKQGLRAFVTDSGIIKDKYKSLLKKTGISFEEGKHTEDLILLTGEIIKSPGIPDQIPLLAKAREKGLPVISEIEFASRFTNAMMICITGSNGKTTTSLLINHILKTAGLNVGLAGNVGSSLALQVAERNYDYYVLEISSFQLDGMFSFKADMAILMNITPDHLDRYDHSFQKYIDSKFRIIQNQTSKDHFIYCLDDEVLRKELSKRGIPSQLHPFSYGKGPQEEGAFTTANDLIININQTEFKMTLEELALQGRHNLYNSMAAGITARLLDIRKDTIKQCLSDFQNIEHRLEFVASIHGIEFINDSKATNVNSTWYALESMHKKVIWIAGGQDKGNDYSLLKSLIGAKVRVIVCLGKDNSKIKAAFGDLVELVVETKSAEEAVRTAYNLAKRGEVVLLSPSCASFDLFENFEDRGNQFKKAVKML